MPKPDLEVKTSANNKKLEMYTDAGTGNKSNSTPSTPLKQNTVNEEVDLSTN